MWPKAILLGWVRRRQTRRQRPGGLLLPVLRVAAALPPASRPARHGWPLGPPGLILAHPAGRLSHRRVVGSTRPSAPAVTAAHGAHDRPPHVLQRLSQSGNWPLR